LSEVPLYGWLPSRSDLAPLNPGPQTRKPKPLNHTPYTRSHEHFKLSEVCSIHTVDYNLFIKSQLTRTQSILRPCGIRIWSRNILELRRNETVVVHRVACSFEGGPTWLERFPPDAGRSTGFTIFLFTNGQPRCPPSSVSDSSFNSFPRQKLTHMYQKQEVQLTGLSNNESRLCEAGPVILIPLDPLIMILVDVATSIHSGYAYMELVPRSSMAWFGFPRPKPRIARPLSSKLGTCKTVRTRIWSWLPGQTH